MKITFANTKGGVGKTTSAIFCAQIMHNRAESVEVWDADPQGSACMWADQAELDFPVVPANLATLKRPTRNKWVFIDTPPGNAEMISAATTDADLVVVPTRASMSDIPRMWATLHALDAQQPKAVLITEAEPRTQMFRSLTENLDEAGVALLPPILKRKMFKEVPGQKPTVMWGYSQVVTEIQEALAE